MRNADDHPRSLDPGSATASEEAVTHVLDESAATGGRSSKPKTVPHFTPAERAARGKAARGELPRSAHAGWEPAPRRRDPSISSRSRRRRVFRSSARSGTGACSCRRSPSSAAPPT